MVDNSTCYFLVGKVNELILSIVTDARNAQLIEKSGTPCYHRNCLGFG